MMKIRRGTVTLLVGVLLLLSVTSCQGINRGEGHVPDFTDENNYMKLIISDTEYLHFMHSSTGYCCGEWVVDGNARFIKAVNPYYPIRDASIWRIFVYDESADCQTFNEIFYTGTTDQKHIIDELIISNPKAKEGTIYIATVSSKEYRPTREVILTHQETVDFLITPPEWKQYCKSDESTLYESKDGSIRYIPRLNVGEWAVNDQIVPIRIELLLFGPGIKVYDISGEEEKEILYATGSLSDENTLILDHFSGNMFYENSVKSLPLIKTTEQSVSALHP